ncbi:unnamed protein product [Rotaria sp. Silwood1]|nr:unnamed protein product [Rotaria sp. Silwood1]
MSFEIDPKQFSDLLDFIKFQNYSGFYDRCREYRQLCLKDLVGNTKLTKEEQDRFQVLESKLDVFTMAYIRHSVELETHLYADTNAYDDYSWWSWWWSGRTNVNQDHHRVIKGNMHDEDEFFSEELLDIEAQLIINKLDFALLSASKKRKLNEKNDIISHIIMENTRMNYKRRAISSSILFIFDIGYFRIFGLKSNEQHRPLVLTSSSKSLNSLIHLEFELAPIHKKADFRFLLIMEPLTIIYHAATINEIVAHFEPIDKNTYSVSSHWRIAVKIAQMAEVELSKIIMTKIINHHESVPLFSSIMIEVINRINLYFNIFPPHTSIESHISIKKLSLIIMHTKTSIETDISCHILKTRDVDEYSKSISIILKNLSMILHSSLVSIQSSWPFYQNNVIELLYSDTGTKL